MAERTNISKASSALITVILMFAAFFAQSSYADLDYGDELKARRLQRQNASEKREEIRDWRNEQRNLNRRGKNCNLDLSGAPVTATSTRRKGTNHVEQTIVVDGDIKMLCGR